jgi:predicted alpha/beta superfamily hydrolase
MPDGGIHEDFLHVAGLVQVSVGNGTMRAFLLVGIENTARRRDMTGPTGDAGDRAIAPVVGGSAAFRRFIRSELMPAVDARYRTTGESAVVGESLAGLFVMETLFLEPDLFDTYIAFDPSLWWNKGELVERAAERIWCATANRSRIWLPTAAFRTDNRRFHDRRLPPPATRRTLGGRGCSAGRRLLRRRRRTRGARGKRQGRRQRPAGRAGALPASPR